jgi:ATP:ADP antiporter, AAA family
MAADRLTRLAMLTAGVMLAHLWAAKAVRSAVFISAWGASSLPAIVFATAIVVLATVPLYARLLGQLGPRRVVPAGLLVSAAGHALEWWLSTANPWVAVGIYLHIAGLGALLLSGFWSLASELFDTQSAKAGYGRIAAAGTIGGLLGGLALERASTLLPGDASLLMLAGFHAVAAGGAFLLGRHGGTPDVTRRFPGSSDADRPGPLFDLSALRASPHIRTIAALVAITTASAFIVEYLFQAGAEEVFPDRAHLQQFLARFYIVVGVATSLAQVAAGSSVRRLGLGRTISSLPLGLGIFGALALVFQAFPMIVIVRGMESALRSSLFRSGYELLFVPMDPAEKRRVKTFLDVACDRAGDAVGAVIVQVILLLAVPLALTSFLNPTLLAVVIVLAAAGLALGRRLDRLYLGVVERRLARHADLSTIFVPSEVGWTLIGLTTPAGISQVVDHPLAPPVPSTKRETDPGLAALGELRSGDRARVRRALSRLDRPDRMQVAQIASLLAWDDVAPDARVVLERHGGAHIGLLVDSLLDPATDFAVRRRLPRVIGTVGSPRAIEGLLWSLEDERFEVRYQAARAIARLRRAHPELPVDPGHIMRAVERELSVPVRLLQGRRLIDHLEREDPENESDQADGGSELELGLEAGNDGIERNLEHIFTLLGAILPREAVRAAHRGVRSADPHLRGLAVEYLDSALPPAIRTRLWAFIDELKAISSASDAPARSDPPPPARPK